MLACPKCGGHLEILDEVSNHLICDTCDYEYNLYGVISPGTYDELDPLADNIMKEHECGNGDETCCGKLAICFDDSSCEKGYTDWSHCDCCHKNQMMEHPELNCWDVNDCSKCDSVKCARSPHFESPKCSIDGRMCNKKSIDML
jgi:hypothetical protein